MTDVQLKEAIEEQAKRLAYPRRNPVRREFRVGDFGYVCRLRWDVDENDVMWVDFEIVPIVGKSNDDAAREFYLLPGFFGISQSTEDLDAAGVFAAGFIKWDGCTQFEIFDNVHVDSEGDLDDMFDAIKETRRVAIVEVMHRWESL